MDRVEQILTNILPGDILLSRNKRDPLRQRTEEGICGYWRNAFLCLEDKKVLVCEDGKCSKVDISEILLDEEDSFGLFRVKKNMLISDFNNMCDTILQSLRLEYNGFHFTFGQDQLTCIGYHGIGVELTEEPYWKAVPLDFDRSSKTVRVV